MKLFNRTEKRSGASGLLSRFARSDSGSHPKRQEATIVEAGNLPFALAFGITWRPIVNRDAAFGDARKSGATYVNQRADKIGYAYISPKQPTVVKGTKLYAASRVAGRHIGGNSIIVMNMGEGHVWLARIEAGQPSSVDKVFRPSGHLELSKEVDALVAEGHEEDKVYRVHTNYDVADFPGSKALAWDELMASASDKEDEFIPMPADNKLSIPRPVLFALIGVSAVLLANQGWKYKVAQDKKRAAALNLAPADEPADVAWARAIKTWEQSRTAPSVTGLLAVRASVDSVPVIWNGWTMLGLNCKAGPLMATAPVNNSQPQESQASTQAQTTLQKVAWACSSEYERSRVGMASVEMAKRIPSQWKADFPGLNKMLITWTVQVDAQQLSLASLKPLEEFKLSAFSQLQALSPIFEQAPTLDFVSVEIPAPKKADGTTYAADASVPKVKQAPLVLKSPLRSIDSFLKDSFDVVWTEFSLTPASLSQMSAIKPTVKQSSIKATVIGAVYAKSN